MEGKSNLLHIKKYIVNLFIFRNLIGEGRTHMRSHIHVITLIAIAISWKTEVSQGAHVLSCDIANAPTTDGVYAI